jgi:hypothetical protein
MRNMVKISALTTVFLGTLAPVLAEEVRIGHLETNDDTGINWLYFKCDQSTAAQMRCDIFQTLIMKKKSHAEIDAELQRQAATDPLVEFSKNFGEACKPLLENAAKVQQAIKSGIGVDGKPINKRVVLSGWSMMKAMIEVCKKPTSESAGQFFKLMAEHDRRSCKVHNDHSQSVFAWSPQTNSWTSQEGPTGPCGTFVLGTLTQEPQSHFWHYVEKTLRTNPNGVLPNGQSCELFPEHTMNYTWQTTTTLEGCDFIESLPD